MLITPRHVQQRFGLVITIPLDLTLWAGMMRLHFLEFTTGHCASQVTLIYSSLEMKAGPLLTVSAGESVFLAGIWHHFKAKRTYLGGNSLCGSRAAAHTFCLFSRYPVVRAPVPKVANNREALRPVSNFEKVLAILPLG